MTHAFHRVLFILSFLVVPYGFAGFEPLGGCGGQVSGKLILPGQAEGLVAMNELSFREALVGAAKRQVESEYHSYGRVVRWVEAYVEGRDNPITLPGQPEVEPAVSGQRAMEKAIEARLEGVRGDERAIKVLKYFGVQYPGVSGPRLQKLARALLIQCYLARFEELAIDRLTLRVPLDTPLLTATGDIVSAVNAEVMEEMRDPIRIEDKFLTILPRLPLRTFGVITDEAGSVEAAYIHADVLALEAAKAKAQALSLDPGIPDVVRDFAKWYLLGVNIRPQGQVHPLLVDWASNVEAFMTLESQK